MKTRVHILFLTFLLYTVTLNAQRLIQIDTISVNYFNGITKKNEIIDNYQITNNSDEDYLTWVSLVPINNRTNHIPYLIVAIKLLVVLELPDIHL